MRKSFDSGLTVSLLIASLYFVACTRFVCAADEPSAPDQRRIAELAAMLPGSPCGVGPTIDDRQAWQAVTAAPDAASVVKQAEELLLQPIPELTDDLYLEFSRTGNRTRCEQVLDRRGKRLFALVVAECIENQGRFLPAIEEVVRSVCAEKTWLWPAHDWNLAGFHGTIVEIDLRTAAVSWDLATTRYWLGEKLSPEARKLICDELQRRTFAPYVSSVTTGKPHHYWLNCNDNWNAVCHAGVTGAALATIESRERRAFFVAAAEQRIRHYLNGFPEDGYCVEGVSYWNYGFGHYMMLAETIWQATGGRIDLMDGPQIRKIAEYGRRIQILPGIYPAFGDYWSDAPSKQMLAFLGRRYGWGWKSIENEGLGLASGSSSWLFNVGVFVFPNSASVMPAAQRGLAPPSLRDWFANAGILICRPKEANTRGCGVAIKGGNNGESHCHADLGSFIVAVGHSTPLADPGTELYTARTFGAHRFESNVINSFGHPVPRVAGQLQVEGKQAAAKILKTDFTDATDTLVMDISSAYKVKELKKLVRTFVFSREGAGRLTVIDEVEFESPQDFGTALITFSSWKQLDANRLTVGEPPEAVQVEITTSGGNVRIEAERIHEDLPGGRIPTRLGVNLPEPVVMATITLAISP